MINTFSKSQDFTMAKCLKMTKMNLRMFLVIIAISCKEYLSNGCEKGTVFLEAFVILVWKQKGDHTFYLDELDWPGKYFMSLRIVIQKTLNPWNWIDYWIVPKWYSNRLSFWFLLIHHLNEKLIEIFLKKYLER